jgi:polyketide cyclase/dehydrase/lipid transport protein
MAKEMKDLEQRSPIVTFHASATSNVPPEDIYEILADPSTHLEWAGKQAPNKAFKLLTLDASKGRASVGTTWASTGANSKNGSMIFHDRSVVTEAAAPNRFAFVTDSQLERKNRKTWEVRLVHRYEVRAERAGSRVTYEARVYPVNYRPYWLHPLIRPLTKKMVKIFASKHIANLSRMAERESSSRRS